MKRRFQNRVAESTVTLPAACIATTLLWWLPQGGYSVEYLLGWLLCAVTAYAVMETAATCRLLRVRSRMTSTLLLLLLAVCGFLHPIQSGTLVLACAALAFRFLLQTYDQPYPQTDTWHAYLFWALGSLFWAPLLLLTPLLLWNQGIFLRTLGGKSMAAALIGLLHPYFFWALGALFLGRADTLAAHFDALCAPFTAPCWWQWALDIIHTASADDCWPLLRRAFLARLQSHLPEAAALTLLLLLASTGFIHYVRKSFDDKIRVRASHYCYLTLMCGAGLWLALQPMHFPQLFPLLLLATAPSAAHFVALTHTAWTNAWTLVLALGLLAVGIVCLIPHT